MFNVTLHRNTSSKRSNQCRNSVTTRQSRIWCQVLHNKAYMTLEYRMSLQIARFWWCFEWLCRHICMFFAMHDSGNNTSVTATTQLHIMCYKWYCDDMVNRSTRIRCHYCHWTALTIEWIIRTHIFEKHQTRHNGRGSHFQVIHACFYDVLKHVHIKLSLYHAKYTCFATSWLYWKKPKKGKKIL